MYTLRNRSAQRVIRISSCEGILLAPGKFPRIAIAAALLVAMLLLVNLATVASPSQSLLYANSLDLAMVLLAALCATYVAARSSGDARLLWALLAVALALEGIAQAISAYYQSFVPGSGQIPWPSDVLFFMWAAPVFMMFLPRAEEETAGIDWIRILDFLQVAIVAATAYLYFFYVPSRWQANHTSLLRQILILYVVRDLLLSAAFLLRACTSRPSWLRLFSAGMALVFLAAVLSDGDYLLTLKTYVGGASLGDLLWALPYFFVILLAAAWRFKSDELPIATVSRFGDIVVTQLLPIGIPLLVIFMGHRIAQEQFVIAWLAVTCSFVCSALRLILTNRKQRRIGKELRTTEQALRRSERIFASAFRWSPDAFSINLFPDGPYLDVNEGFTRVTGFTREETLDKTPSQMNLWLEPTARARILSQLIDTSEVREQEFQFRTKTGQVRTGQMSAALVELDGRRCSLVVVRDITARKEAEDILRSNEARFRSLVEHLHVGIVLFGPDAKIQFVNQATISTFGIQSAEVLGKTGLDLGLVALREDGTPLPDESRPIPSVIATRRPIRSHMVGWQRPGSDEIIWTLLDAVPEFDGGGQLVRVIMSLTNLTAQRHALDALRESEDRFRTLVRDLHVGVVLHGPDARIQFANRAALEMFGTTEEAILDKQVMDLGISAITEEGEDVPFEQLPAPAVLQTRSAVRSVVLGWRRPGNPEILWIFGNATPQFDAQGSIVRVITTFADISEMKNAERAIHQLSTQLLKLQDEERRRIGRELHDGLAQTVLAINLSLAQVRQTLQPGETTARQALEKARGLLQQMSREIRTLSYLLHPPLLDDLGLVSALKEYTQGFSERSGIDTQIYVLTQFGRLPQQAETALFRIVQESLANIQRHSGSKTAKIRLRQDSAVVILEVADAGCGMNFPPNGGRQSKALRLGVGIPGMRERMAQLGGELEIDTGPTGTTVRATIPRGDVVSRKDENDGPSHPHRG